MNASFEALQGIDYVIHEKISSENYYPAFNDPNINIQIFNDLLDSYYTKINNWDDYVVSLTIQMIGDNTNAGVVFSQDCNSTHIEPVSNMDVSIGKLPYGLLSVISGNNFDVNNSVYHHFNTYVKDLAKYVSDIDVDMKIYLDGQF